VRTSVVGLGLLAALLAGCAGTLTAPLSPEAQAALSRPCMQTGSRITLKEGECSPHPGRVYTREQLDSTGSFDVAEALRKLDPSIF
jgi:hypothetical protein